jgi:hypothetical protein
MLVFGLLVISKTWRLTEAPVQIRASTAGCRVDRTVAAPADPVAARDSADFIAVATVVETAKQSEVPEAHTPESEWITATYRVENAIVNRVGCGSTVQITNRIAKGLAPSTQDAPLPGARVLVSARPEVTGDYHYMTKAAAPVDMKKDSSVFKVIRDQKAPATSLPAAGAANPTVAGDVDEPDSVQPFYTPGPTTEVPVRVTVVNTTGVAIDQQALGAAQWTVSLVDADGQSWTASVPVTAGSFPAVLQPGDRVSTAFVTRPVGPAPLRQGIYRLEPRLDAQIPIDSIPTTIEIDCVVACG